MEKLRLILMTIAVVLSAAYGLSAQEKYAIIITGDSPGDGYIGQYAVPNSDYDEFWNDTYLMWEMLVTKYGFNDQNVYVLYATGLDENQINPNIATRYTVANSGTLLPKITDYEATIEKVNNVLIGLANGSNNLPYVMEDDFLFVFTFGHGIDDLVNGVVHGYLKLNDGFMIDTQFGNLINGIHSKRKVIWMENCCGGDFQDEFTNDYCYFLSASGTYGASGAYPADDIFKMNNNSTYVSQLENEVIGQNTYTHGEWIFHMYSNANGASPDGDLFYVQSGNEYEIYGIGDYTNFDDNQDGFKTNKELFNYAFLTNSLQQIPQEADYGNIGD